MAQTARMWNSADCYAMTATLGAAETAPGKPGKAVGLTAGLGPVWMLHRVYGNKVVRYRSSRDGRSAQAGDAGKR